MRVLSADEKAIIFLDSFEYIEYKHKRAIFDLCSSPKVIFEDKSVIEKYFQSNGKAGVASTVLGAISDESLVEDTVQKSLRGATEVLTFISDGYPKELKSTPTPPLVL